MNEPAHIQTIMQKGKPAFLVIPFDEYVHLFPKSARVPEGDAIPYGAVGLTSKKGVYPRPRLVRISGIMALRYQ
jgi:hypothetical protein